MPYSVVTVQQTGSTEMVKDDKTALMQLHSYWKIETYLVKIIHEIVS